MHRMCDVAWEPSGSDHGRMSADTGTVTVGKLWRGLTRVLYQRFSV